MRILQFEISGIEFKELANQIYTRFEFKFHNASDDMIFMIYERSYLYEISVCNIISIKKQGVKLVLDAISSNAALTLRRSTWGQRRFHKHVRKIMKQLQEENGFEMVEIKDELIPWNGHA